METKMFADFLDNPPKRVEENKKSKEIQKEEEKPVLSTSTTPFRKPKDEEDSSLTISQKQIKDSLNFIEIQKSKGLESITKIAIENEEDEKQRKLNQEKLMNELVEKMKIEGKRSAIKNASIAMRWPLVLKKQVPNEIQKELEEQERECQKILKSKDELIKEFKTILKDKDDEYVNNLKKQSDEVQSIIDTMVKQIKNLSVSYQKELEKIELSFEQERNELIQDKEKEVKKLQEKRKEKELKLIETRVKEVEENEKKLNHLIASEMEKFSITKKEKDEKLEDLEKSIDNMRGVFELNAEKLKYYHALIFKRTKDNKQVIKNNKSKLSKMQDQLTKIKAKYDKDDKKFKQLNIELTEQYAKMVKRYKDLLSKFKYFEISDSRKYQEIWKMNEKIIREHANKLIESDQRITENILNQKWIAPNFDLLNKLDTNSPLDPSFNKISSAGASGNTKNGRMGIDPIRKKMQKRILLHFLDKSGFLIEDRVKKTLDSISKDESGLLRFNSVLKALGINQNKDIQRLIDILSSRVEGIENIKDDQNWKDALDFQLSSTDIIGCLNQFLIELRTSSKDENKKKRVILNLKQIEKQRKEKEEMDFWKRFEDVIPDQKFQLWKVLENSQEKYHKMLLKRKSLAEENAKIRRQNGELEELLNEYMKQSINDELYVKPDV